MVAEQAMERTEEAAVLEVELQGGTEFQLIAIVRQEQAVVRTRGEVVKTALLLQDLALVLLLTQVSGTLSREEEAGGGWYGGGAGGHAGGGGGGGSGYIYTEATAAHYPSGCLLNSSYYLSDAYTTAGQNSGNGKARITLVE